MSKRARSDRRTSRVMKTALHGAALIWHVRVWLWHTTPQAALLPGVLGFGWFFKYMTFWGYTLQTLTLAACLLDDLFPASQPGSVLGTLSDDMSCMSFAFAHVVTVMFHAVSAATKGVVEGAEHLRPHWLNPSIHVYNSVVAWLDLIISQPRSFSHRARISCCGVAGLYTCFILLCRELNGRFPYPFLNALPFPSGFIFIFVSSISVFAIFFQIGSAVNSGVSWALRGTGASKVVRPYKQ